jgi:hypothetical protein
VTNGKDPKQGLEGEVNNPNPTWHDDRPQPPQHHFLDAAARTSEAARVNLLRFFVFSLSSLSLCVRALCWTCAPCFVAKSHKHTLNNPSYAQFLSEILVRRSEAEVLGSSLIKNELSQTHKVHVQVPFFSSRFRLIITQRSRLLCYCFFWCGMALHIALVANEAFARANSNKLEARIATDYPEAFVGCGAMDSDDYAMTCRPADKVFAQASAS